MPPDVALEPIAPKHAEAVQRLASDPAVTAATRLPEPYPEGGAAAWIQHVQPRHEAGEEYAFAVLSAEGALVGVCGLMNVQPKQVELGYWIGRPFWNRGYATAAARQATDFAFRAARVDRVVAYPLETNAASRRVLVKLGFTRKGTKAADHPKWKDECMAVYEMTRPRWDDR